MPAAKKNRTRSDSHLSAKNESNVTKLSQRDRDRFLALLEDDTTKPNKALLDAAKHYREHFQSEPE